MVTTKPYLGVDFPHFPGWNAAGKKGKVKPGELHYQSGSQQVVIGCH